MERARRERRRLEAARRRLAQRLLARGRHGAKHYLRLGERERLTGSFREGSEKAPRRLPAAPPFEGASASSARVSERARPRGSALLGKLASAFRTRWHSRPACKKAPGSFNGGVGVGTVRHSDPARSYEQMTPASASPLRCSTCSACLLTPPAVKRRRSRPPRVRRLPRLIPKPADQPQTGQDKLDSAASSRERSRAWPSRRARSAAHAAACLACSLSSRHFACRSWSAPPWAKAAWRT